MEWGIVGNITKVALMPKHTCLPLTAPASHRYTNLLSFTISAAFADSPLDASFAFELAVYCSNCPRLGQLELVTAYLCPVDMLMMCLLQLKVPFTTRFYLYPGTQCPLVGPSWICCCFYCFSWSWSWSCLP